MVCNAKMVKLLPLLPPPPVPSGVLRVADGGIHGDRDSEAGVRGQPLAFMTPRCHNGGGKAAGPSQDAVTGTVNQVYMPLLLLTNYASYDSTGYSIHIPNRPHDCRGACKAQGSKAKPTSQVKATQSKQSEG
jgi:hypothetical protein